MKHKALFFALLAASFGLNAEEGIHYYDQDNCEVCEIEPDERAWYHRIDYMEHDGREDPTLKLDEDTAWPGEREEFSDVLFR